jgi:hypothetical protein
MLRHCLKRTKGAIHGSPRSKKTERGQGLVEYALGLVLVSLVATVSLALMGDSVKQVYCSAVRTLDPATECTPIDTLAPTILNTHYDEDNDELRITAKAADDCPENLIVQWSGNSYEMTRQGSSYVFKTTIEHPPSEVQVGHNSCGWTTVDVGG